MKWWSRLSPKAQMSIVNHAKTSGFFINVFHEGMQIDWKNADTNLKGALCYAYCDLREQLQIAEKEET